MSGGSMNYLYCQILDANFAENSPLRRAFRAHLIKVAAACRAIEWNDSGDGDSEEEALIRFVVSPTEELRQATNDARQALEDLQKAFAVCADARIKELDKEDAP